MKRKSFSIEIGRATEIEQEEHEEKVRTGEGTGERRGGTLKKS